MRLRLRSSLLLLVAAVLMLAQNPLENPRVRALGEQLLCLCGCGSSVTSCNMLHCHFSEPVRKQLLSMVQAGMSDSDIIASFVKDHGPRILMKPPAEGFNLVGWVMPFVALAAGLALLWFFIKRFHKPLPAAGPEPDAATLARYQERIDKEMESLDR